MRATLIPPPAAAPPEALGMAMQSSQESSSVEKPIPGPAPNGDAELLIHAQRYLTYRARGLPFGQDLEAAWMAFYDLHSRKIRSFAFTCGVAEEHILDCVQEVWTELLVRLPTFRLDPTRGKFDSWLFHIVRSKSVDLRRGHKRHLLQANGDTLQTVVDDHPSPAPTLEEQETLTLAWHQLKKRLSACNFQVLQLRLVEERPVAEVADKLGLSHEQVWYRYHRARREAEQIGSSLAHGQRSPRPPDDLSHKKTEKTRKSAQG